jgi:hypothetical protein
MAKEKFQRKIQTVVMFEEPEVKFLDRKINTKVDGMDSRSALIRTLIRRAMENPALLDPIKK